MGKDLESMGEFGIVEIFRRAASTENSKRLGIGDDCAVIPILDFSPGQLLVTTDSLVQDIHFIQDKASPRTIGYKSLAVSVSDIAAMGGRPVAAFLSIALTSRVDEAWVRNFTEGFMHCAHQFGIELLGGDTVASENEIFINVTLLGKTESPKPVNRHGAKPGDIIYLGRPTGDSAAGLHLLKNQFSGLEREDRDYLIQTHLLPKPQVQLGLHLGKHGSVNAMIDVSDGLLQDLGHICDESALGAEIHAEDIPMSEPLKKFGKLSGHSPLDWSLSGGEDYCLLFCVDPKSASGTEAMCMREMDLQIFKIGTMIHERGVNVFSNGNRLDLKKSGYDHFSRLT